MRRLVLAVLLLTAIPAFARKPKPLLYTVDCGICSVNARRAATYLRNGLLDAAHFLPADPQHYRSAKVLHIAVNEIVSASGETSLQFTSALGLNVFVETVQTCPRDTPLLCVEDFANHLRDLLQVDGGNAHQQ